VNNVLVSSLPQQKQAQSVADEKRSKPKRCGVGDSHTREQTNEPKKCGVGDSHTREQTDEVVCDPPVVGGVCEQRVVFGEVFLTQRAAKLRPHNGRDARRTLWLVVDGGANCLALQALYKHWLFNLRVAPPGSVIMMNSHPEVITHFGDLCVDVRDEATGEWKTLFAENVAVVPGSDFNLLGWSFFAKQLQRRGVDKPQLLHGVESAVMSVEGGESVTAKLRHGLFTLRARKRRRDTHTDVKSDDTQVSPTGKSVVPRQPPPAGGVGGGRRGHCLVSHLFSLHLCRCRCLVNQTGSRQTCCTRTNARPSMPTLTMALWCLTLFCPTLFPSRTVSNST